MFSIIRRNSATFQLITSVTVFLFVWTFLLSSPVAAASIKVPAGTSIVLKTNTALSPELLNVGDSVKLSVVSDVLINGKVVVKAGASAIGEVIVAKKRNMVGIAAKLIVAAKSVNAVDGTTLALAGNKTVEGKDQMVVSIALTLLCCLLFALMKGGDASIAADTQITCTIAGTAEVDVQ